MSSCPRVLLVAIVLLVVPAISSADEKPATLSGSALSVSGLALPGATIRIVHVESGRVLTVVAGDGGVWRSGPLSPGLYEVVAEARGHLPARARVTLEPGPASELDLRLAPSAFEESIIVTAPSPRDSLEASRIRESGARDAAEALTALPGVWMLRKGGIANEIVMRGLQARDTSLAIDGQRVYGACPNHMDPPSFHVDFAEVDRIEISKGPFDVRNQGSLGGSVNVVTRQPDAGWHATPALTAGSWSYVNPSVSVSYGHEKVSLLAGYSSRSSDPYDDGSGSPFTEVANYLPSEMDDEPFRVGTGWARASFEAAEGHDLRLSWSRQAADDVRYPYLLMDAIYDDTDRVGLTYDFGGSGGFDGLTVQGYFSRVDHWMTDEMRVSSLSKPREYSMASEAATRTTGGRVEGRWGRLTAGVEFARRYWEVETWMAGMGYAAQASLPGVAIVNAAVYAESEVPLTDRWSLRAGGRLERADSDADDDRAPTSLYYAYHATRSTSASDLLPAGNVRVVWHDDAGLELSAGFGMSSRVPEPNERYFALKRQGSDWVGNPDLEPSRNFGTDFTAAFRRAGHFVGVSLFDYEVDDYITVRDQPRQRTVPGVMNTVARSYLNNDATLTGAEVDAAFSLTSRLVLGGDVSYVRGRQDRNRAEGILSADLAEMPPLRARTSLRFNAAWWWAEVEGVFSARQGNVDASLLEEPTSSWGILNLKGGIEKAAWTATVGVTNVFDRLYTDHLSYQRDPFRSGTRVYEPGIGLYCTVGYRF